MYMCKFKVPALYLHKAGTCPDQHQSPTTSLHALKFLLHAGLRDLQSIPVDHCREAYGLVMSLQDGCKLAYSGDTRPCPRFARASQGATLLVHEATFAPDLQSMVRAGVAA